MLPKVAAQIVNWFGALCFYCDYIKSRNNSLNRDLLPDKAMSEMWQKTKNTMERNNE